MEEDQWQDLLSRSYRKVVLFGVSYAVTPVLWGLILEMVLHQNLNFRGTALTFPEAYAALVLVAVFGLSLLASKVIGPIVTTRMSSWNTKGAFPRPFSEMFQGLTISMAAGVTPGIVGFLLSMFTGNRLFVWVGVLLCWVIMALNFPRSERWKETAERMRS